MAIAQGNFVREMTPPPSTESDESHSEAEILTDVPPENGTRTRRSLLSLRTSPLTRKIVIFNLIALNILVAGILYLDSSRDSLVLQRATSLVSTAELIADVVEASVPADETGDLSEDRAVQLQETLRGLSLRTDVGVFIYSRSEELLASMAGQTSTAAVPESGQGQDWLTRLLRRVTSIWQTADVPVPVPLSDKIKPLISQSVAYGTQIRNEQDVAGGALFTVATPIMAGQRAIGVVAVATAAGEIDSLVRAERWSVLQMFVIAAVVSVGLSLVLASTIANPLADLAAAAELGRDRKTRNMNPGRVRIPDLTARPDEIGRLSGALRSMIAALYNRIEGNEQFAADVAHEIKNPLASLRSAVGTLRLIKRDDQREKLLDVIDHDVRRLDRLVTDISNASRLDSELVTEKQEPFDVLKMLDPLALHLGEDARSRGIEFITDMPQQPIMVYGLEARLAQVFVNLITNAISFCVPGDTIRVWARRKDSRILIVVEDTGPGIPDQALSKIFFRFYSQRPVEHFGNNSGLGLAISKQIVEAHGGVVWAENIRPTEADITSEPHGTRFVVGLPI